MHKRPEPFVAWKMMALIPLRLVLLCGVGLATAAWAMSGTDPMLPAPGLPYPTTPTKDAFRSAMSNIQSLRSVATNSDETPALAIGATAVAMLPNPLGLVKNAINDFGAVCDGTTDDAPKFNRGTTALGDAGGGDLVIPAGLTCAVDSTIIVPAGVRLVGFGHNASHLVAKSPNLTLLTLNGNDAGVTGLEINSSAAGTNSSGATVNIAPHLSRILISNNKIIGSFDGITTSTSVLVSIINNYIYAPTPVTGACIKITGGNNQVLINNFCQGIDSSHQPRAALEVTATEGLWAWNMQGLWSGQGAIYIPGPSQAVTWVFEGASAYDNGTGNGILLQPKGGGSIRGYSCVQCWTSTMANSGVAITQDGASTIDGVSFQQHRSFNNQGLGFNVIYAKNLQLNGGAVCGNSGASPGTLDGISLGANVDGAIIQGMRIGDCVGTIAAIQRNGIDVANGANNLNITGNDLRGNKRPLDLLIASSSFAIVNSNIGVDDQIPALTASAVVALPPNPIILMSGTATIRHLNGGWQGRALTILPLSEIQFATGGNISNAETAKPNVPITAMMAGTSWYLK